MYRHRDHCIPKPVEGEYIVVSGFIGEWAVGIIDGHRRIACGPGETPRPDGDPLSWTHGQQVAYRVIDVVPRNRCLPLKCHLTQIYRTGGGIADVIKGENGQGVWGVIPGSLKGQVA